MHRSLLFLLPQALLALDFPSTPPVEPKDAAKTFHVLDGFEMQLIAAEPLVTDPVAITYDADGRAYVCEMNDYPYTDKATHKPSQENPTDAHIGKVRLLTDTDGDGTFDKATVFTDGLSWPTGAACWKGGIFVTATPDVWYLKDTNDDGVADVRQKVFTGFKKLNVQAVMNNPIWGLDHRIYIAGGSNGGEIQRVPGSESVMPLPKDFKPLPIKRNDFSFDPSTGDVRLESGGARFGNTFDDWGNRFLCNIRNPCQHVVLPYRYLARNPYLVVPSALNDCAEAGDQLPVYRTSPPEPWREFRAKRWVQEGSTLPKSELVGAGVVTSSAGITVYRGDAYPKEYRDFAFVADVAGNLFYRMKLVPDGVTFKAVQVDGKANFCTSDDLWFRPVNFVNAPDGCLHVCDMYREVIEHPWSIPDDIHTAVDLLRGRDKGRIWRLIPRTVVPPSGGSEKAPAKAGTTKRSTPKLSAATTPDLVALLDHSNAWHRETALRLLFERQDRAAVEPLRELVKSGKTAQGRVSALWSLHSNSEQTNDVDLQNAMEDDSEPVVENAVQVIEDLLPPPTPTVLADPSDKMLHLGSLLHNVGHGSKRVSFRTILAVGGHRDLSSTPLLSELAEKNCEDSWIRTAALLGARMSAYWFGVMSNQLHLKSYPAGLDLLLSGVVRGYAQDPDDTLRFHALLAATACEPDNEEAAEELLAAWIQGSAKTGDTVQKLLGRTKSITALDGNEISQEMVDAINKKLKSIVERQSARLAKQETPINQKLVAIKVITGEPLPRSAKYLAPLLNPSQTDELQLAALEALGSYHEPAVAEMLIGAWPKLTPTLRDKATTLLLSRTDRTAKLLDAIETKKILPAQLSVAAKATLGRQKTPALAERIAKLIVDGSSSNRKEVITKYASVISINGDVTRGSKVYEMACMVCHKFADKGNDVGPHLGTIKAWTAEQLVTNILDPNREVSPNFALYIVETNDGRTLAGLIASETAGNLTLKRADGGTDTVLRSEIKSLTSPGISLMPEGLEAAITPQQMADLIAYLKQ
jgi:putative membrane-bound dehydrogenase-like protein